MLATREGFNHNTSEAHTRTFQLERLSLQAAAAIRLQPFVYLRLLLTVSRIQVNWTDNQTYTSKLSHYDSHMADEAGCHWSAGQSRALLH